MSPLQQAQTSHIGDSQGSLPFCLGKMLNSEIADIIGFMWGGVENMSSTNRTVYKSLIFLQCPSYEPPQPADSLRLPNN